jgi:hypothetical protein
MYARLCETRCGRAASKTGREKAQELKRKGDVQGHKIWNDVAEEIEQRNATRRSSASAR